MGGSYELPYSLSGVRNRLAGGSRRRCENDGRAEPGGVSRPITWCCCIHRWHLVCVGVCRRWKDVHHAEGISQGVPRGHDPGLPRLPRVRGPGREGLRHCSPSCLKRWLTIDDKNSANPSPAARAANELDALREANKRIKLLEQENEVLRRAAAYLSQANLPGK